MKLDTHVHTQFSGYSTIKPINRIMRESYDSVDGVYRLAKARGMRRHTFIACALIGLSLLALPFVFAPGHSVLEDRFSRELLVDLVANRTPGVPEVA